MGTAPMTHPKRTWNGLMERRALLAAAGIEIPGDLPGCDAAADDVLDAAAVAWTAARKVRGEARTLPEEPPWDGGRAVAIWY
jgi:predicted RNase H-like nuclease